MTPNRVSVVGVSGSGKSTIGPKIAARIDAPYLELDSVNWQANWTELAEEEFRGQVADFIGRPRWVVDGSYIRRLGGLVLDRCDLIVWLDLPKAVVTARVLKRSFGRAISKRPLWNGNVERFSNWRGDDNPVRFVLSHYDDLHDRLEAQVDDRWVRLRSQSEVDAWLAALHS